MRFIILIALLLPACTSLNTRLPEVSSLAVKSEQVAQEKQVFAEISRLRARLDDVAHRVLQANAELCKKTAPDIGVKTQTIKAFPKGIRAGAQRDLGLTEEPKIVFVRAGSPGAEAGLAIGDTLLDEKGEPIPVPSKDISRLIEAGSPLQVARGGTSSRVNLKSVPACDYTVNLKMTAAINAYATGRSITVTAGMMNFVKTDDELAYIIGHELAHNTQSHIRKSITNYVLSLGGTRFTRPFEAEADYVGIYYMERAGFDSLGVEDLWRRLARQSLTPIGRAKTHPAYPSRTVQIKATRREISAKKQSGKALRPEPRRSDDD